MRVFLSHSSADKGFVEAVADQLRPGTYELDSQTFDYGLINSQAIIEALQRSDLFCLFLSNRSVRSSYVDFETLLGVEFFARGGVGKILVICLDEEAFSKAVGSTKFFNIVRKASVVETAVKLIQGSLISAANKKTGRPNPFIGRKDELEELERQITDHKRPLPKVIYVSGHYGAGRRAVIQKFYESHYPEVSRVFSTVKIEQLFGVEELYRKTLTELRPSMAAAEFRTRIHAFSNASLDEKRRQIAQLLNSLLHAREATLFVDLGGVLTDAGAFESEIDAVISSLDARPHPPLIIISNRNIPSKLRRHQNDAAYLSLKSLKHETSERLASFLLKENGIAADEDQFKAIVSLGDCHPNNYYKLVDEIINRGGVAQFLANPGDFIQWKHRQSSEYLEKVTLSDQDVQILALLKIVPELDFQSITDALPVDPAEASDALLRLANLHIIEASADRVTISPPLRIAVEKDNRIVLPKELRKSAINALAKALSVRLEDGTAPIALVDSAVISSIESGGVISSFTSAFLLPSHYVWLAKRHYDEKGYEECIRLAKEALAGIDRLSRNALVTACRFMCLAAARIGDAATFDQGIDILEKNAADDWSKSNVAYLKGFNLRMKGMLPIAEEFFRRAYALSPGNKSASREIAAICLARGNLDEAEKFAREAHEQARTNPYFLDILISILIRKYGGARNVNSEINDLFEILERSGEEDGRSFYTTRKAEFEHLWGNNRKALELIEDAVKKTPSIFEPKRLYVEILLKDGNKTKALEIINDLEGRVNSRNPNERRTNYRAYLEIYAKYLTEVGRYDDAKNIFGNSDIFSANERIAAIKDVEIVQSYRRNS